MWITSLFNVETSRFTPLDFRLTAAVQFRLLEMFCSLMKVTMEDLQSEFLAGQLVTKQAIPLTSLDDQVSVVIKKFETFKQMSFPPVDAGYVVMAISRLSPHYSALHTNKFRLVAPELNYYFESTAFYPTNDHAIFDDVSVLQECISTYLGRP